MQVGQGHQRWSSLSPGNDRLDTLIAILDGRGLRADPVRWSSPVKWTFGMYWQGLTRVKGPTLA
jgi:hypothetical protein